MSLRMTMKKALSLEGEKLSAYLAGRHAACRDRFMDEARHSETARRTSVQIARRFHHNYLRYIRKLTIAAALTLSGCCLAPNTVRTEVQHVSHVTQHFGPDRTNMGYEAFNVVAQWKKGGAYLDVGDGVNVSPRDGYQCIGGMCGPREIFTASVGYVFQVRP